LQSVLCRKEAFPEAVIELISDDFGMEIKCDHLGIRYLRPDPEKKLPDVEDVHAKQLRQTQQELERYKKTLPDLELSFRNERNVSSSFFNFVLRSTLPIDIENEMKRLYERYPQRESDPSSLPPHLLLANVPKYETERYNRELEEFFINYRSYHEFSEKLREMRARSVEVHLFLENKGHVPAQEIDIHIHFPDGMVVLDPENMPPGLQDRKPPDPPKEPSTGIERLFRIEDLNPFINTPFPSLRNVMRTEEPNVSPPRIRKTSSYDVHYEVGKIKHGYFHDLGGLVIIFPSKEEAKSFSVQYQVTADNHPESQSGELHFVLSS
jgi:hypothetical protein